MGHDLSFASPTRAEEGVTDLSFVSVAAISVVSGYILRTDLPRVTNYERHLPMEEAFPDTGFDTSQINNYMEQHFR